MLGEYLQGAFISYGVTTFFTKHFLQWNVLACVPDQLRRMIQSKNLEIMMQGMSYNYLILEETNI